MVFYCATIAYHVGLNALSEAAQTLRQRLRKITEFDGVLELACTLAVHCGRSSYFSRWLPCWKVD